VADPRYPGNGYEDQFPGDEYAAEGREGPYHRPEQPEPKQVIVMRKDLGMRKGKMIAQGAHASLKVFLDRMPKTTDGDFVLRRTTPAMVSWLEGRFTKVCVSVSSEADLVGVYETAKAAGLPCALIEDAGLTEFKGVPTKTCCAIGPAQPSEIDPITGGLKLL
jgi:PTH2 family peptidyl-tRNA hydrolase